MWTLLKSFIKERPAVYSVHPICAMANRVGAVFRDYFIHTFTLLIRGYRGYCQSRSMRTCHLPCSGNLMQNIPVILSIARQTFPHERQPFDDILYSYYLFFSQYIGVYPPRKFPCRPCLSVLCIVPQCWVILELGENNHH